mmetsp:Transcript_71723/g.167958  ORF Transcript_71723/g.167958 Transcript_71723/m.167958 type:complete len:223 (-) Transcript_71723:885-1553(-)
MPRQLMLILRKVLANRVSQRRLEGFRFDTELPTAVVHVQPSQRIHAATCLRAGHANQRQVPAFTERLGTGAVGRPGQSLDGRPQPVTFPKFSRPVLAEGAITSAAKIRLLRGLALCHVQPHLHFSDSGEVLHRHFATGQRAAPHEIFYLIGVVVEDDVLHQVCNSGQHVLGILQIVLCGVGHEDRPDRGVGAINEVSVSTTDHLSHTLCLSCVRQQRGGDEG